MKSETGHTKGKRLLAAAAAILIGCLLLATILCAILGAPANVLLSLLFLDLALPLFLYLCLWVRRILGSGRK